MFNCCIRPNHNFGLRSESEGWKNKTIINNVSFQASFNCEKDCWICYTGGNIENLCECKNLKAHKKCLAKWQFKNMGKPEEKECRFCKTQFKCTWKDEFFREDLLTKLIDIVPEVTVTRLENSVTSNEVSKDIKLYSTGYNAFLEIMSHFAISEDMINSFECTLYIKGCKKLKLNRFNVTAELMNNIIFCAKLSLYKKK
jgi:hypothetical protein